MKIMIFPVRCLVSITTQAVLGHSSPEITREIYLHSILADAKGAVEKIEKLVEEAKAESGLIGPKF